MDGMMQGVLLYEETDAGQNRFLIERFISCAKEQGLALKLLIGQASPALAEEILAKHPDFVINRTRNYHIARKLEKEGVAVYNNAMVTELGNDKWKMYQYVKKHTKIPMADTNYLACFDASVAATLKKKGGEWIVKSLFGHGGKEVFCYPLDDADTIKKGLMAQPVIIQPRIKGLPRDVRVYILWGKVYAAMLREGRAGDYRSNYTLGGSCKPTSLPDMPKKWVETLSKLLTPSFVGMDFILDEDGNWYFNELEDMVGNRMLYTYTEYDIVQDFMHLLASGINP